jgi:hypothetical protein
VNRDQHSATAKIQNILGSADGQKTYLAWRKNPMTQDLLAAALEQVSPHIPTQDGLSSDYLLGHSVGGHFVLDYLKAGDAGASSNHVTQPLPKPMYGARKTPTNNPR